MGRPLPVLSVHCRRATSCSTSGSLPFARLCAAGCGTLAAARNCAPEGQKCAPEGQKCAPEGQKCAPEGQKASARLRPQQNLTMIRGGILPR
jgi:hypothetical protein